MIKMVNHMIRQQTLEINFGDMREAIGVQDRVAELFYGSLLPKMETLFDEITDQGYIISLEKLEIDCGILSRKNWEEEWVDSVLRELKAKLITVDKKKIRPDDTAASFFFFLEHGRLPWNSRVASISEWDKSLLIDSDFIKKFKQYLASRAINTRRLAGQFSTVFLEKLINKLTEDDEKIARIISAARQGSGIVAGNRTAYFEIFERLVDVIKNDSGKPIDKTVEKEITKALKPEREMDENIYIDNAGLIILHPFLPRLFELCGFTHEDVWINGEALQQALALTGFLVTGSEEIPEFRLSLNKVICGMDLIAPVTEVVLSDKMKIAGEEMLNATIGNWNVLKNTSVDGLRTSFLQREGKLTRVDKGWLLHAEHKPFDILMQHLPWGIGTIKLPWMKEIVFTEWS